MTTEVDAVQPADRRKGHCKWFNVVKGFGFITPDDGQPDVFIHQTVIKMEGFRSLAEGESVEFVAKQCEKGLEASFVCGPGGTECRGTERRPVGKRKTRKIRCYNCGEFANHVAAKCPHGTQPKRCHNCKSESHLVADCPNKSQSTASTVEATTVEAGSQSPSAVADSKATPQNAK